MESGKIHQIRSYGKSFLSPRSGISSQAITTANKNAQPIKKPYQLTLNNNKSTITKTITTAAKIAIVIKNFFVLILNPKKLKYSFTANFYPKIKMLKFLYVNYIIIVKLMSN